MSAKSSKKSKAQVQSKQSLHSVKPLLAWYKDYALALVLITLLPAALYWQTTSYGYVLDDKIVITDNSYTQKGFEGVWDIFTTESFQGYFGERKNLVQGNRYRPLSIATFAIEQGLWGSQPGASHGINILLYILTGWLLLRVLSHLFPIEKRKWYAGLALGTTLLFLSHPLHSEAVANIKGRDEIMAMLLSLWTLWLAIQYAVKPSKGRWIGLAAIFFLGLLAKENTITFLAVIPLTMWALQRASWSSIIRVTAGLSITTIAYLAVRFNAAGVPDFAQEIRDIMNNPFYGMSGAEKSATIFFTFAKYLKLLVVPYPLSHDYYPYAIPKVIWTNPISIISLMGHLSAAIWALWTLRKRSIPAYSILYYLITFSIVSNVVINVGTFMNERFVYMASLGYCLLLAYLLLRWLPAQWKEVGAKVGIGLVALVTVTYSAITIDRVPAWQSALALNQSAVRVSSGSARANSFMGTALFNDYIAASDKAGSMHLLDEAEVYVDRALDIFPAYGNGNTMRLGIAAERFKVDRKIDPLLVDFEKVILYRPDMNYIGEFLDYLHGRGTYREPLLQFYDRVGNKLINEQSNLQWGIHYLERATQVDYRNSRINQSLANAYQLAGQPQKAQEILNRIR